MEHPYFPGLDVRIDARGGEPPFYSVSTTKLALLSLLTFGLYEIVWFYKNWSRVPDASLSAFWRAAFSIIFCYSFAERVNEEAEKLELAPKVGAAPIALLVMTHRLPDPYWLLSSFSFVPLLFVSGQIRAIHERMRPGCAYSTGWNGASIAAVVVGGVLTLLAVVGTFYE